MEIAAAAPVIPWSDLVYSLTPNGRTLDYRGHRAPPTTSTPPGVMKQSFVDRPVRAGLAQRLLRARGRRPRRRPDRAGTRRINAGEPYDGDPAAADIIDEISRHHSAYYVDRSSGRPRRCSSPTA